MRWYAIASATLFAVCMLQGCGGHRDDSSGAIVLEGATVLPMTAGYPVLSDTTVVIEGERIIAVGPSAEIRVPAGALHVDARGKFLMPALADMHVHIESDDLFRRWGMDRPGAGFDTADLMLPYVAHGVLQVFNLSATEDAIRQRSEIESGSVLGPHIALAYMVDGDPPVRPGTRVASNPEEGMRIVAEVDGAGYDALKTYSNLSKDTFLAMVREARRRGLKVVGHIPLREGGQTENLLIPGFGMIAHAEELAYQAQQGVSPDNIPAYLDLLRDTGVWLTTTVKLNENVVQMTISPESVEELPGIEYLHPLAYRQWRHANRYSATASLLPRRKQVVEFNRELVRAMAEAELPFVVGTDSLVTGNVPGVALHDELEALVVAGASNEAVLAAATRLPAQWLGVIDDRGTVEAGKRANLLLLDADPMHDISSTRRISAVIANGRYLSRQTLDMMLHEQARRYASIKAPRREE